MQKESFFIIECRTGCSCCQNENHYRGIFKTVEDANGRIKFYRESEGDNRFFPIASQYARRGRYSVQKIEVETLPDGRKIIDNDIVISPEKFIIVTPNPDGSLTDNESETISWKNYWKDY